MTTQLDRPERRARSKPVPAADSAVDPIDYRPGLPAAPQVSEQEQTTTPPTSTMPLPSSGRDNPTSGPQVTVQLGVAVSPDIAQLVEAERRKTGRSKRSIVEQAILAALRS